MSMSLNFRNFATTLLIMLLLTLSVRSLFADAAPRLQGNGGSAGMAPSAQQYQPGPTAGLTGQPDASRPTTRVNNMTAAEVARRKIDAGLYIEGTVKRGAVFVPESGMDIALKKLENEAEKIRAKAAAVKARADNKRFLAAMSAGSAGSKKEREIVFAMASETAMKISKLDAPQAGLTEVEYEAQEKYRDYLFEVQALSLTAVNRLTEFHRDLLIADGLIAGDRHNGKSIGRHRRTSTTPATYTTTTTVVSDNGPNWVQLIILVGIAAVLIILGWKGIRRAWNWCGQKNRNRQNPEAAARRRSPERGGW